MKLHIDFLGVSNSEKWGDHQKKKFFISNSVKYQIQFKEEHGLLKLHVPLGEAEERKSFFEAENNVWGGFSEPIEI